MGWSAQYFTTIIIQGDTPLTGIFIYNGPPGLGNLIGSWTTSGGQDAFGNTFDAGINITQGDITGASISDCTATALSILSSTIVNSTLSNPTINNGQINETVIVFDSGGGQVFGYTTSTTTDTFSTAGDFTFTGPAGVSAASVTAYAAGAGGDGGSTSEGGNGGGAGECAQEPSYPLTAGKTYTGTVGQAGSNSSTGAGHGGDGGDSFFDQNGTAGGVHANGGLGDGTGGTGSTNTKHYDGGTGGAASGFSGGASGGNSGNTTAKGNNGIASTGSSGAASPAAQTGSGTGGAGGNNGANGSDGIAPGGAGGGAGQGSTVSNSKAIAYAMDWQASYYGPDASGGNANNYRTQNPIYQGGETASGGSYNGTMRSAMVYNRDQVASDFAGYTITQIAVQFKNEHSWYSSGMSIEIDYPLNNKLPSSVPSTWPGSNWTRIETVTIAEGDTHLFGLPVSLANELINNTNAIGIGTNLVAENHGFDLTYYGYFDPSQTRLKFWGTTSTSGSADSGAGADGQVLITYASSSAIEFALSPVSGSDASGNAYEAGYTGRIYAFTPGSSPATVEGWHTATLQNGWTNHNSVFPCQYRFTPFNEIEIIGRVSAGTASTIFTLPYTPNYAFFVGAAHDFNDTANTYGIYVQTSGAVQCVGPSTTPTDLNFHCFIPLDTIS